MYWRYTFEAIEWKIRMKSEQALIHSHTLYESIIIALSMAFGGKSGDNAEAAKATTADELNRELAAFFNP